MTTDRLLHILFQLRREWLPRGNREELEAEVTRTFEDLRARIADLEAQLAALRDIEWRSGLVANFIAANPQPQMYRLVMLALLERVGRDGFGVVTIADLMKWTGLDEEEASGVFYQYCENGWDYSTPAFDVYKRLPSEFQFCILSMATPKWLPMKG